MGLRAVLFDIDDTLFSTTQFAKVARKNAVRAMVETGLDLPEDVVLKELEEVLTEFTSNYDHHFDQLLRRLRPKALESVNPALIVAAGIAAYHDTKFRELKPFDDVIPLLQALHAAGVITGIITHGWTIKQAEKIVRLGLVPHLDRRAVFISDQLGISKPNPKIYALALRDLGLQAAQAMYVGDSPSHDITPPKSLGMKAVWAKRASRFQPGPADATPDHVVQDFVELRGILRERYELGV
ncbi:MAG: TIGR02253 family HAD-type hydrolase [Planctomycetes bacterium]|nr:TIGR02253 family HAD-type hydrolase [Planctomycetota bacterium]